MRILILVSILTLFGCNEKPEGFQLPGSQFYFKTHTFKDPKILAEAAGVQIQREVLQNSPVLRDLETQANDIKLALIYKRASDLLKNNNSPAELISYIPTQHTSLRPILSRLNIPEKENIQFKFESASDRTTLALLKSTIGNLYFTEKDFDRKHFAFQSLERRRALEIAQQVSGHLSRRLLRAEAKKKSQSLQEFSDEVVAQSNVQVSDADLTEHLRKIGMKKEDLDPSLMDRMRKSVLEKKKQVAIEKYVRKNLLNGPVLIALERPRAQLIVDKNFEAIKGIENAPISIVSFGSASCADCAPAINALKKILDRYEGFLRMNWIHFSTAPLGYDGMISQAALCAENQSPGLSFDFLFRFTDTAGQDDDSVFADWIADQKEGDREEFLDCMRSKKSEKLFNQHLAYAHANGVVNNPTLWIEGSMIEGRVTEPLIQAEIEKIIQERNLSRWKAWLRKWKARISGWLS